MQDPTAEHHRDRIGLHRDESNGCYSFDLDGEVVAVATFHELGKDITVLTHSEVLGSRRGQGIGALLVGAVLDDLRRRHQQVIPQCWYVAQFIDENPDYLDLIAVES